MDIMLTRRCCLLLTLAACCLAASVHYEDTDGKVADFVDRMRRESTDAIHGYSLAVVHAEHPDTRHIHRLTRRDLLTHVTHPSSASRRVSLELQSGEHLHMDLARRSVVTSGTRIVERFANNVEINHVAPRDCFFSGSVEGPLGHASLSFCGGELMGSLNTEKRQYQVHPLPASLSERYRRSTDLVHALVTWTDVDSSQGHNKRSLADKKDYWAEDALEIPLTGEEGETVEQWLDRRSKDQQWEEERKRRGLVEHPVQRNSSSGDVVVEVGAFMDTLHQKSLANSYGLNETKQFINLAILKWSGIWSVLSDPKLGWNITVRLVRLEIWAENPDWYNGNENSTLDARMASICKGERNVPLDYAMVWSKASRSGGLLGLSWVTGTCMTNYHCSAIQPQGIRYDTELHEFGHSLGLPHDNELPNCSRTEPHGFMGSDNAYARLCYKYRFDSNFPRMKCLFKELYEADETEPLVLMTGGQQLGFDGQCQYQYGEEFVYLPGSESMCSTFKCLASDVQKSNHGLVRTGHPAIGTPCAPGRLCMGGRCPPLANTSYPRVMELNTIVNGGWGSWSPLSVCKSSRSGAAAFRVASRLCNNPEPKLGAFCEGSPLKAELCDSSSRASSGAVDLDSLANEICARQHVSGYTGSGEGVDYRGTDPIERCTVHCKLSKGSFSRESYILPDGVLCDDNGLDHFRGVRRFCLNGVCTPFGCNNKTLGDGGGLSKDMCGDCGGTGDSCFHGEFRGPLANGERHTLVLVPKGATDIYVEHNYGEEPNINIEVWTADDQPVISRQMGVGFAGDLMAHPASFAGTQWYFQRNVEALSAPGPLDQPAKITVYNRASFQVRLISFRYRSPVGSVPVG